MLQVLLLMPTNKPGKAARPEGHLDRLLFCTRNETSLRLD